MKKMLYTKGWFCKEFKSILGYEKYEGLETYRNIFARNKVVLKCDIAPQIVSGRYLSEDNLKYANALCKVFMGLIYTGNDIWELQVKTSAIIKDLVMLDSVFRRKVEEIYNFKFLTSASPISFFNALSFDFRESYDEEINRLVNSLGALGLTIMYYDGTVVWYAINDIVDNVVEYDSRYKQEVVSSAKAWNYSFDPK